MDSETLSLLSDALSAGDVAAIVAAAVLLAVPIVLKALGKSVPVLDTLLALAPRLVRALRKDKLPPEAPKAPEAAEKPVEGVASVVPLKRADPQEPSK